jgi:hypothetical protein
MREITGAEEEVAPAVGAPSGTLISCDLPPLSSDRRLTVSHLGDQIIRRGDIGEP